MEDAMFGDSFEDELVGDDDSNTDSFDLDILDLAPTPTALSPRNASLTEAADAQTTFFRVVGNIQFLLFEDLGTLTSVTGLHGHTICSPPQKVKEGASISSVWKFKCGEGHIKVAVRGHSGAITVHKIIKAPGGAHRTLYHRFSVPVAFTEEECSVDPVFVCQYYDFALSVCRRDGRWIEC
jgi:hypothetical protein